MQRDSGTKPLQKKKLRSRKTPKPQQLKPRKMRLRVSELLLLLNRSNNSKKKRPLWLSLTHRRLLLLKADVPRLPRKDKNASKP